ncbi:MAG: HDOD domain-containing protein [Deltaproteobacteria bacterium]|nr:HDOD domain-containing protein [Deltaproteobacteria bacterium]
MAAEPQTEGPLPFDRIRELPTVPEVYSRVVAVIDNPRSSVWEVEKIVRQDPAITAKILRLVNSPLYGLRSPASTVAQAVRTIGYDALKQIVLTSSVISLFRPDKNPLLSPKAYWGHCLGTAAAARQLALCLGEEHPEEFFVAGLLHDIGKLVHNQYLPEKFHAVLTRAASERLTVADAERALLGFSHDQTGGLLVQRWGLAPAIQRAVAYHHAPAVEDCLPPTLHEHVVHCADIISAALGLGASGSHRLPPFMSLSWDVLRLSPGHLAEVVAATRREFSQLMDALFEGNDSRPS